MDVDAELIEVETPAPNGNGERAIGAEVRLSPKHAQELLRLQSESMLEASKLGELQVRIERLKAERAAAVAAVSARAMQAHARTRELAAGYGIELDGGEDWVFDPSKSALRRRS